MADCETIPNLTFNITDDGAIALEQDMGCDETDYILIHPSQLGLVAQHAGPLESGDSRRFGGGETAARRLRIVAVKLRSLAGVERRDKSIAGHSGCGTDFFTNLDALAGLADEFVQDPDTVQAPSRCTLWQPADTEEPADALEAEGAQHVTQMLAGIS